MASRTAAAGERGTFAAADVEPQDWAGGAVGRDLFPSTLSLMVAVTMEEDPVHLARRAPATRPVMADRPHALAPITRAAVFVGASKYTRLLL